MILVDANILIYSHVKSFAQHEPARRWLDQQLSGSTRVGLPWASLLAFLRLVTNPRVFEQPESISDAWRQVREWTSFSLCPACMPISCPMLVWLRSRSNMGSRCIRPMETLHDFQNCVGQIRLVLNEENPVMDGACASASGSDPKSPK